MNENGRKITPKQVQAIQALLTTPTITAAVEKAGIAERTIYRWLADADFQAALTEAESALLRDIQRELLSKSTAAVEEMERVMHNAEADGTRLRAAQLILEYAAKLRSQAITEERLADIESRLEKLGK
jgi:thiamine phosphate synthase YjbQ (UPF0047 family)